MPSFFREMKEEGGGGEIGATTYGEIVLENRFPARHPVWPNLSQMMQRATCAEWSVVAGRTWMEKLDSAGMKFDDDVVLLRLCRPRGPLLVSALPPVGGSLKAILATPDGSAVVLLRSPSCWSEPVQPVFIRGARSYSVHACPLGLLLLHDA